MGGMVIMTVKELQEWIKTMEYYDDTPVMIRNTKTGYVENAEKVHSEDALILEPEGWHQ